MKQGYVLTYIVEEVFSTFKYPFLFLIGIQSLSLLAQPMFTDCPEELWIDLSDDEIVLHGDRELCEYFRAYGGQLKVNVLCDESLSHLEAEYIFEFDRCDGAMGLADVTFTIPDGEMPDDITLCPVLEVHFPNGKVGYYDGERNPEGPGPGYFLEECLMPCVALYLKDSWGGVIDVSFPQNATIENEPHSMPYIDFGCVEICRMATRSFNLMPCEIPLELQDVTVLELLEMLDPDDVTIYQNPLLTGMEICPDVGVEIPEFGWCCNYQDGQVRMSTREECERRAGREFFETEEAAIMACRAGLPEQTIADQINAMIEALVLDGCYVTIHNIHISHANGHLPVGIESNVVNGDGPFELISPDPMSFPMNVSLGGNLEFEIKFKPSYSGPFYGRVEICFENSCPCFEEECPRSDPTCCEDCPEGYECVERQPGMYGCRPLDSPESQINGFVCEYSTMVFDIHGYGANCLEYEGPVPTTEPSTPPVANNAALLCGDKCPPCISTASTLNPEGDVGLVCRSRYFKYLTGVVVEGAKSENPTECGEWCLNLINGSSSLFISNSMPSWVLLLPDSYVNTMDCGEYDHPGFPYFFLDEDNDVLYLVKSGDMPPIVVDLILTLPYATNCGDFEPGETFNIVHNGGVATYEYIACDGYNLFAKYVSGNVADPSDIYIAEFSNLGTYAHYYPVNCSDNGEPEYCGMWYTESCHNFRTDLFVVDEDAGLLCNKYFLHEQTLEGSSEPGTESTINHECEIDEINFGCTVPGEPITHDFVILNCDNPLLRIPYLPEGQPNGPFNIPFEVTCDELFPDNLTPPHDITLDYDFGANCTIEIEEIFFVGKEQCGAMLLNAGPNTQNFPLNGTPHNFSLVSPSLPASIMKGQSIGLEIEFDPEEPGTQCAYVVICYENDCPSCNLTPALPEGFEAAGFLEHDFPCNTGKIFVFEVEGCSVGFEVTDKDPTSEDPCSCEDERNITNPNTGQVLFFHDVLKIIPGEDDETQWFLNQPLAGTLYDENGVAIPPGDYPIPGTPEMMDGMEVFIWHIWHRAGELVTVEFENEEGGTLVRDVAICEDICTPIPTLGQWGIIILGLLMMIFGTVAVKQRSMNLQPTEK